MHSCGSGLAWPGKGDVLLFSAPFGSAAEGKAASPGNAYARGSALSNKIPALAAGPGGSALTSVCSCFTVMAAC